MQNYIPGESVAAQKKRLGLMTKGGPDFSREWAALQSFSRRSQSTATVTRQSDLVAAAHALRKRARTEIHFDVEKAIKILEAEGAEVLELAAFSDELRRIRHAGSWDR